VEMLGVGKSNALHCLAKTTTSISPYNTTPKDIIVVTAYLFLD
jgi:hypothetical protein